MPVLLNIHSQLVWGLVLRVLAWRMLQLVGRGKLRPPGRTAAAAAGLARAGCRLLLAGNSCVIRHLKMPVYVLIYITMYDIILYDSSHK